MLPRLSNQPQVKREVMDGSDLERQQLIRFEQMMQVSTAVKRIDIRMRVRIDRRKIVSPFAVAHVHRTESSEELTVTPVACRHDTVEHIHAPFDGFEQVHRRTDSHQVARLVFRQNAVDQFDHFVHFLRRFTYRQSADRVPIGSDCSYVFGCPCA